MVKDIYPGAASSSPCEPDGRRRLAVLPGQRRRPRHGAVEERRHGRRHGHGQADINPGAASSNPSSIRAFGSSVVFAANDGAHGSELWKSDGTAAGTAMVADIAAGSGGSNIANVTVSGSKIYFSAVTAASGNELWSSDGTAGGTAMVQDINPGAPARCRRM